MIPSPTAAGLLLLVSASACTACPWYYLTAKGILAIHWSVINFVYSSSDWKDHTSNGQILLALASVVLLAESFVKISSKEELLTFTQATTIFLCLVTVDLFINSLLQISRFEIGLGLCIACCVFLMLSAKFRERETSFDCFVNLNSCDLFSDVKQPLHFLGRSLGGLHLASIAVACAVQVSCSYGNRLTVTVFLISTSDLVRLPDCLLSLLFVIRSLSSLSMLFLPANFGGFVQALKRVGRACGSRFAQPDKRAADSTNSSFLAPTLLDSNGELSLAQ